MIGVMRIRSNPHRAGQRPILALATGLAACGDSEPRPRVRSPRGPPQPTTRRSSPRSGAPRRALRAGERDPRPGGLPAYDERIAGPRRPPRRRQQVGLVVWPLPRGVPVLPAARQPSGQAPSGSSASTPRTPTTRRRRSSRSCRCPIRATATRTSRSRRRSTRSASSPRRSSTAQTARSPTSIAAATRTPARSMACSSVSAVTMP